MLNIIVSKALHFKIIASSIPSRSAQKCEYFSLSANSSITTSSLFPVLDNALAKATRPANRPSKNLIVAGRVLQCSFNARPS